MAVGRISGPLLKQNLVRDGVDLAFETDLLYLDVNNSRVGINNDAPQFDLDINGTARFPTLEITTFADIADINITGNTISTNGDTIRLGTGSNVIYQNRLNIDNIDIEGNRISTNSSNAPIEFAPNGTGKVNVFSDMNVQGDIFATGNITADGEITIGNEDTDFITFNAEVNSDIIPDATNTYNLGSDPTTGGKQWQDVYVENFFAGTIDTTGLIVDGIELQLRQGNIFYVAENGSDDLSGTHQNDPFGTIAKALSEASNGDTVFVYPGTYSEEFPLTIPQGVTLKGHSIRSVIIEPSLATQDQDAVLLNGECTIEDVTLRNFFYNVDNDTGYGFRFAENFIVNSRSPYIKNVSVITQGSTPQGNFEDSTAEDPRGFLSGDAGKGAYLDGSVAQENSREVSCLFHSVTFITPGVDAVTFTNGVRIEWLNCFTYFANRSVYCFDGTEGIKSRGKTALRVSDITGSFDADETITYYDTDGTTVIATAPIEAIDTDGKIFITGKVEGFETAEERSGKTVVVNGNVSLATHIKKYGISSLEIPGDAGDYLNIAPQNDFGFGTGDFTVEAWVYANAGGLAGTKGIIDFRAGTGTDVGLFLFTTSGQPSVFINGSTVLQSGDALSTEQWVHIAVVQSSGTMTLYVNGVSKDSAAVATNLGTAKPMSIGARYDGSISNWNGYIDDIRVQKGNAQYTSSFTPPITQLYANNDTVLLLRFNGDDSSVVIEDEVIYEQDIRFSGGATATKIDLVDYTDFGAEVRMIGSASVYGNFGLFGVGQGVIIYAIGHNVAYIGNGKEVTNDTTTVIQDNEIVSLDGAKIRFNSVDHNGDFRVGDLFYVNQKDGTVTFTAANFNVDADQGLTFTDGINTTIIDGEKVQTGNIKISGNTIETLSGDMNLIAASDQINLNNNVNIDGNLDVTGSVTIGGDITIGDENTDEIQIVAGIGSDIVPEISSRHNLGSADKTWKTLFADRILVDSIELNDNYIRTVDSNANLELRASGTGVIEIDNFRIDDITISTDNDIILDSGTRLVRVDTTGALKLPVGDTSQRPSAEAGLVRFNNELSRFEGYDGSDWIQLNGVVDLDGDTRVTAELSQGANDNVIRFDIENNTIVTIDTQKLTAPRILVDDILLDTNVITTVSTDTDLVLQANGSGSVILENFGFTENSITNIVSDSITLIENTGNGYVKVTGTNGFVIPVGDATNRPDPLFTETGMIRFNTADGRIEAFDGQQFRSVAGETGAISSVDANFLAVETVLYLG